MSDTTADGMHPQIEKDESNGVQRMIRPKFLKKQDTWMLSRAMKIHPIERPDQLIRMQDGTTYKVDPNTGSLKNTSKNRAKFRKLRHAISKIK